MLKSSIGARDELINRITDDVSVGANIAAATGVTGARAIADIVLTRQRGPLGRAIRLRLTARLFMV